jgi:hypothetical protein
VRGRTAWALDRFNDWFVSDGGVWQTLLLCVAVVVVEQFYPRLDPDHFIVLYVLTVYSGITQPALARAGRVSGERQERMIAKMEELEEQNTVLLQELCSMREDQRRTMEKVTGSSEESDNG